MGYLYITVPLCRVPTGMISKKNDSFLSRLFCHILTDALGPAALGGCEAVGPGLGHPPRHTPPLRVGSWRPSIAGLRV